MYICLHNFVPGILLLCTLFVRIFCPNMYVGLLIMLLFQCPINTALTPFFRHQVGVGLIAEELCSWTTDFST